jgi:serine/threonine protein kinase
MHVRALRQLLSALEHIHSHGAVHGDVKLENALVEVRAGVQELPPY